MGKFHENIGEIGGGNEQQTGSAKKRAKNLKNHESGLFFLSSLIDTHRERNTARVHGAATRRTLSLTAISRWTYHCPSDQWSQATSSPLSTWIGDGLGIGGAVSTFVALPCCRILLHTVASCQPRRLYAFTARMSLCHSLQSLTY